ncbi:MAG: lysophospholipid acyltransferase family protein [Acidobacteriota bacterium]
MTRGLFYWLIKSLAWPMTHFYVRMSVEGDRAIPRAGACIVVANHRSYADPVLLGSAFPRRIHFLIARPVYRLYRMRWFYYMMGSIPVSRKAPDPGAMKRALRILRGGGVIGIFPEGQRVGAGPRARS